MIPRCDHSHSPRPVVMLVAMLVACVYKIAHCSMLRAAAGSNGMSRGLLPVVVGCGVSKTSSGPEGVDVGFFGYFCRLLSAMVLSTMVVCIIVTKRYVYS